MKIKKIENNKYLILIFIFVKSLFFIKIINTVFYQDRLLSLTQIGIVLATYQISKMLFEVPTGIFGDKYGRKKSLLIGAVLILLHIIFNYISYNYYLFVMSNIILGVAVTFTSGSDHAILVDSLIIEGKKESIGKYGVYIQVVFYSSLALSSLISGFVADVFNYDVVYLLQIIIFIFPIIILLFIEEPYHLTEKEKGEVKLLNILSFCFKNSIIKFVLFIHIFIAIAFISIDYHYGSFLIMSDIDIKIVGVVIFLQQIIACIFVVVILKRIGNKHKSLLIKLLPIIMMCILFVVFFVNKFYITVLLFFIAQLLFLLINPLIFEYSQIEMPSKFRASIGSLFSFGLGIAGTFSHLIFSLSSTALPINYTFVLLSLISLILLSFNLLKYGKSIE